MAEELQAGGVCGGNLWINSTRNLLFNGLSPCSSSLISESFGWLNPDPIFDPKTSRISGPGHDWNPDLIHGNGSSPEDYHLHHTAMDYPPTLYSDSRENQGFPWSSSTYTYVSSLVENLFDDSQLFNGNSTTDNSLASGYMTNQDMYVGDLGLINQPENQSPFAGSGNSPGSFLPAEQPQVVHCKRSNPSNFNAERSYEECHSTGKKVSNEPPMKRQRIATPSPLPTFKVRKEKLGDRVTALQQLVSPFGKTDTASVLHEAIEYIKFLHDQVRVLSDPYFKGKSPLQQLQQATQGVHDWDLRSQGLCLMPILSTFPVATGTSSDFWMPTFGESFR